MEGQSHYIANVTDGVPYSVYRGIDISIWWPEFSIACILYAIIFCIEFFFCVVLFRKRPRRKYILAIFSETFCTSLFFLIYVTMLFNDGLLHRNDGAEIYPIRWGCYTIISILRFYQLTVLEEFKKAQKHFILLPLSLSVVTILMIPQFLTSVIVRSVWMGFGYVLQGISLYLMVRGSKINAERALYFILLVLYLHCYEIMVVIGTSNFLLIPYLAEVIILLVVDGLFSTIIPFYHIFYNKMERRAEKREADEYDDAIISDSSRLGTSSSQRPLNIRSRDR